ncbi:MAG: response regulator [Pseudomonadota bacterium]
MANPARILLIEDNPADVLLTEHAFRSNGLHNEIDVCKDGEAAIAYLHAHDHDDETLPHLVLLDLNLPKVSGLEVLQFIKRHDRLKRIPVIVLTSSSAGPDVDRSYDAHANGYIVKPVDFGQLQNIVKSMDEFWFSIVVLPGQTSSGS